jgi:hypothetical protein
VRTRGMDNFFHRLDLFIIRSGTNTKGIHIIIGMP